MNKYICIHGHFYQPPRENAWLEEIELQESAYPFHDWNERITSECYGPNTASRILNGDGDIREISNNYSRISFNFGATLLSWMEVKDPEAYNEILVADRISIERFGHGSAIAQVYNHIIMPLANKRDKETQVIWGIKDFEHRFNRKPEGMWLAETAVDLETLDVLAHHGIKFTILAPHQAKAFKLPGSDTWQQTNDSPVDTRVPYVCKLPSGRSITLFFYDGGRSQAVAFNNLLSNGKSFAESLLNGFDKDSQSPQLVHIATDGESYGHHHKHGDMALAYALDYIDRSEDVEIVNYASYLSKCDQIGECEIIENSSWSCVHGIERWRNNCGCNSGGRPTWNQEWRKPLRDSLNWLRDELNIDFAKYSVEVLNNPWHARNKYIDVILDRESKTIHQHLNDNPDQSDQITRGIRWLEMERNALLMFTSCGWFFDEVSGLETTQILQYACRAMQLNHQLTGKNLEDQFVSLLEGAPSNLPEFDTAADVYRAYVVPTRLTLERVGMHFAVSTLFEKDIESINVFNYTAIGEDFERLEGGMQKFVCGMIRIRSDVTFSEKQFAFAVLYLGQHNIIGNISVNMKKDTFDEMKGIMKTAFEESRLGEMIGYMQSYFGPEKYTLWHLFKDQKRKVINQILKENLRQVENSFKKIYNRDYPLINMMKASGIPIPKAYKTTLEYVLNADLKNCLSSERIDLEELKRLSIEFNKWEVKIDDTLAVSKYASERIFRTIKKIQKYQEDVDRVNRLNRFFEYIKIFELKPDLSRSQNIYFYLMKSIKQSINGQRKNQNDEFTKLGDNLGVIVN